MAYLLDTNVLITAKNLYYGIDFCPGFWEWIEHMGSAGTVRSVSKVKDEITSGDDDLAEWIETLHTTRRRWRSSSRLRTTT